MGTLDKLEKSFAAAKKACEGFQAATAGIKRETESAGKAAEKAAPKMSKFMQSILRVAKYRMIRAALRGVVDAVKEGAENFYNFSKEVGAPFAAAMDDVRASASMMKNQLGSAFGELYQQIAPIILTIIEMLNKLANALTMIFAAFGGKGGWYKAKTGFEAIEDAAGGAGSAAKEALRYLAPFDELNRLPAENKGGGGGGGGNSNSFADMYEFVPFEEGGTLDTISGYVRERLEAIDLLVDVFVFGVGAVLAFSGANIPLGIAMMAVGAYKFFNDANTNWNAITKKMKGPLSKGTAMVSGAALLIGAVLTFTGGNPGLGIGLMIAGAAGLATAVSVNWDSIKSKLQGPIGTATALISGATLLLGVLLCTAQLWGPGLGLIAAGAGGLGATVSANWNAIVDKIDNIIFNVKKALSLAVAWVKDYVGRGLVQFLIDQFNGFINKQIQRINTFVDLINGVLATIPDSIKEALNIPEDFYLEHVPELEIIPSLQPPIGQLYEEAKKEWEQKTATHKMETQSVAEVDEFIDNLPETTKQLAMTANLNKRTVEDGVQRPVNVTANLSRREVADSVKNPVNVTALMKNADTSAIQNQSVDVYAKYTYVYSGMKTTPSIDVYARVRGLDPQSQLTMAEGGAFHGGVWHDIPQYARGTASAHGSMFIAGEAGPEVVGHIGGRTEVLNKSQLAATMYAAVRSAMSSVSFRMGGMPSVGFDFAAMEEVMYSAFVRAMNDADKGETVVLDGEVLYRKMVDRNRAATYRMGTNPMMSMA